jgi:hypothetical protein
MRIVCSNFTSNVTGFFTSIPTTETIRFMFTITNPTMNKSVMYLPVAVYTVAVANWAKLNFNFVREAVYLQNIALPALSVPSTSTLTQIPATID